MKTLCTILILASSVAAYSDDIDHAPPLVANPPSAIANRTSEIAYRPSPIPTQCPGGVCPPRYYRPTPPSAARAIPQLAAAQHDAVVRVQSGNGLGSGVLVYADGGTGIVITARHVVEPYDGQVRVAFRDGRSVVSSEVTADKEGSDLAAVVVDVPSGIEPVEVGDPPQPGEWVLACGYGSGQYAAQPNRVTRYVTYSAPGDGIELQGTVRSGDSGGPVFNARGQVVAIVNASSQPGESGQDNLGTQCGPIRAFLGRVRDSFKALFGRRRANSGSANPGPPPGEIGTAPSDPNNSQLVPPSGSASSAPSDLARLLSDVEKIRSGNQALLDGLKTSDVRAVGLGTKLDALGGGLGTLHQKLDTLQSGLGENLGGLHDAVSGVEKLVAGVGPRLAALAPQLGAASQAAAPAAGLIPGLGPGLSIALYVLGGLAAGGSGLKLWQQVSPAGSAAAPGNGALASIQSQLQQLLSAASPATSPPSSIANPPLPVAPVAVVSTQSPPAPQSVVNTQSFVPVAVDQHQQAYQWATQQMAGKYPGALQNIDTLNSLIGQFLSAQRS